jgi:hypothetical protein
MTGRHWRIWTLAAPGWQFFEGLVVFITGVAMLIAGEFKITAAEHGATGAASLLGILIGAAGASTPNGAS